MDFSLNEEQRHWQLEARKFAREEIAPISLERDQVEGAFEPWSWDIIRKGSKLGFRTLGVPKKWGGPGVDMVTQTIVMVELAKGDSAISKAFSQNWKFSHRIANACTEDQQERFLKPFLADDTYVIGGASTEPNAGSDNRLPPDEDITAGWKLKAEPRGDEYILNGDKCFIANGSVAKLFFVSTRTNPQARLREGSTMFLVPRDTPGLRIGKVFNKSGWRFYQNAELIFEDARVPAANVVGAANSGERSRAKSPDFSDFELAANALGVCDASVEGAMRHVTTASRAGRPLGDHQLVQLKISEMHMRTEALRSFVLRTAWEIDNRIPNSVNAVLVMNLAAETIQRVATLNLHIHTASGATMHAGAEKLVRDAIIWTHLAGDAVQQMKGARRLIKQYAERVKENA